MTTQQDAGRRFQYPRWLPRGADSVQLPAGVDWDAVDVPAYLGDRVLSLLGEKSGAVIRDPYGHRLVWLIQPGAGSSWVFPTISSVQILGAGCRLIVPPAARVRSAHCHWARPIRRGVEWQTDPEDLHTALDTVIAAALGPHMEASR